MKATLIRIVMTALTATLLAGCSGKPGASFIEEQASQYVANSFPVGIFRVENAKKVNGYANDSQHYTAQVEYDLVLLVSKQDVINRMQQVAESPKEMMDLGRYMNIAFRLKDNAKPGDRERPVEEFSFIKTENGWVLVGK